MGINAKFAGRAMLLGRFGERMSMDRVMATLKPMSRRRRHSAVAVTEYFDKEQTNDDCKKTKQISSR
ncbi:MAG: hypothetical protein HOH80_02015 [Rhodospirillaceae bacterium]|jgi:hypothetical protein|nr:hypothetical protein [Rhodospirillaceae bacterium]